MNTSGFEIHYNDDNWAALYVDGKLEQVGDADLANERALEMLGVTLVHDDAFMRGQSQRVGVAQTLDAVKAFSEYRQDARTRAQQLRMQADQLTAQAKALEAGAGWEA